MGSSSDFLNGISFFARGIFLGGFLCFFFLFVGLFWGGFVVVLFGLLLLLLGFLLWFGVFLRGFVYVP